MPPRLRRPRPDFSKLDPTEGAKEFLRFAWELSEENADRLDRLERQQEQILKFLPPLYEMVYRMASGGRAITPQPGAGVTIPQAIRDVAADGARRGARALFEYLRRQGVL